MLAWGKRDGRTRHVGGSRGGPGNPLRRQQGYRCDIRSRGVTLYYETLGQGEPLLLVHGNGGSIGALAAQMEHFKATHNVIAMDSRDQGRSATAQEPITYEKMTDGLAALIDHLTVGPVDVVGGAMAASKLFFLAFAIPTR